MQSYLQYCRFGKHVKAQYRRDHEKVLELDRHGQDTSLPAQPEHHSSSNSSTSSTPSTASPLPDTRDPEKAEHAPGEAQSGIDTGLKAYPPPSRPGTPSHGRERPDMIRRATTESRKSLGTNLGRALTGIDVRESTKTEGGGSGKVFVVGYEGDNDIMNPHNWSLATRIGATMNIAGIGWVVGFASSVDSAAIIQGTKEFGVSEVTESLATGLFIIGFGAGAMFAGPISETLGRNPVYIATLSLYIVFIMASALAPNIGAQLAFRFLAGFFGSTPLTCAGGSLSDLWSPMERVYAFPIFANAAFMGPIFGPVVGGFIGQSSRVNWRFTEWITLIISGFVLILVTLFQPETYAAILLKWKASHLREITGDDRYRAEVEIRKESFPFRLRQALYRPFLLTFREPVIMLLALYLTVIYIILFTFLNGYTFIFTETYGFSEGLTGLSFLGIGIGLCGATLLVPLIYSRAQKELTCIKAAGGDRLPPEFRLWFAMLGAPCIPVSMLWMGWTAYPSISPWCPLAASVLFGYGILCVFISSYQYIIDSYESFAASALASVTLIRYVAAGGMVEVAVPMYGRLGVHWTLTLLGAISALLVPVPYLFFIYGEKIRGRSRYAVA